MLESSFLTVERQEGDTWLTVARDAEWETRIGECWVGANNMTSNEIDFENSEWERTNIILGESEVTIHWDIPDDMEPGTYRIGE